MFSCGASKRGIHCPPPTIPTPHIKRQFFLLKIYRRDFLKQSVLNCSALSERRCLASCHFCHRPLFSLVHFSSEKALPLLLVWREFLFCGNKCSKDGQVVSTNKAIQVMSAHNADCAALENSIVCKPN